MAGGLGWGFSAGAADQHKTTILWKRRVRRRAAANSPDAAATQRPNGKSGPGELGRDFLQIPRHLELVSREPAPSRITAGRTDPEWEKQRTQVPPGRPLQCSEISEALRTRVVSTSLGVDVDEVDAVSRRVISRHLTL